MRKTLNVLTIGLVASALFVTACNKQNNSKLHTYNQYLMVSPSNWNLLTYQDGNDMEIANFINGSLFTFNFSFDEHGEIIEGAYETEYDGATNLVDVTADYAGVNPYGIPEGAAHDYAYKITLRDDLKWDDGTPIHAADFVYSMKEQLNPLFLNYRANSYYGGSCVIANAERYVKQGQEGMFASKGIYSEYTSAIDEQLIFDSYPGDGAKSTDEDSYLLSRLISFNPAYKPYYTKDSAMGGVFLAASVFGAEFEFDPEDAAQEMDGKTFKEIKEDETLLSYWTAIDGWWQTDPNEELDFFISAYAYPEMAFENVGIKVGENENELVLILSSPLQLLDGDDLYYKAAYNLSSLPLVKQDIYEACKVAPTEPGGLWTTVYDKSVDSTASWGPYKLTYFQSGKQFILERNDQWYGYNMPEYEGQYQTDRIVTDIVPNWNTAWLAFQSGNITRIGIDPSIAADYRNSSRAVFTPSEYIGSIILQSDTLALSGTEEPGYDKEMLGYEKFRKAVSLALDRADYCQKLTTAGMPSFGYFNDMHYIAVDQGLTYRSQDAAKIAICLTYGVDPADYDSLDEAYAAVTGYNLELARQLVDEAYAEALAAGTISADDVFRVTYGSPSDSEAVSRHYNYIVSLFETLVEGTQLDGRVEILSNFSYGDAWFEAFTAGSYEILEAGWEGGAWDPAYFMSAYLDPDSTYYPTWDPDQYLLTYNPYGDGEPSHEYTMGLYEWDKCIRGISEDHPELNEWLHQTAEFRCGVLAQIERCVLGLYYMIPAYSHYSAALNSYKIELGTTTYNTFMGYGGFRYMTYNYNDGEWSRVKSSFDYKA